MNRCLRRRSVFLALVTALLVAAPVAAQNRPKLDCVLNQTVSKSLTSGKHHKVILRARAGHLNRLRQQLAADGQDISVGHPSVDGLSLELDSAQITALCATSMVDGCSTDSEITATAAPASKTQASEKIATVASVNSMLRNIGLTADVNAGRGITVALIDSGISPSKAFAGRIKAFYDFTNRRSRSRRAYDDYGHGTQVAGLIGGHQGVAPGVDFVVIKVLDGDGRGQASHVMRAIEFAVANAGDAHLAIDVINLSLGHPIEPAATDPLVKAVERASAAGIVVVTSAGNFGTNPETGEIGYAGTMSPGNAPSAITVGAYDRKATATRGDDRVTAYSSRGPSWYDGRSKPDVVAPGHYLTSEASLGSGLVTKYPGLGRRGPSGKAFLALSGTSMAACVTTGVVALLQQTAAANRLRLTPNLAKAIMPCTAIPLADNDGTLYDVLTQGAGGLNAAGAVQLTRTFDLTVADTEVPWTRHEPCGTSLNACSTTIAGRAELWARNIVWGENIIWGDNIVWSDNIVGSDNIVWGDGLLMGVRVVTGGRQ